MPAPAALLQLAHIGKIPVEEWLPFVVPVIALYVLGRRRERRRRREVSGMPASSRELDPEVVGRILACWREAGYEDLGPEHLPLLYPPGPDGLNVTELAGLADSDEQTVRRLLEGMERADYLQLDPEPISGGFEASLTARGLGLLDVTEDALLTALREQDGAEHRD